jgi:hypothetical protein
MVPGGRSGSGILLEANIPMRTKTTKGRNHVFRPCTSKKSSSAHKENANIKKMTGSGERWRPITMPLLKLNKR